MFLWASICAWGWDFSCSGSAQTIDETQARMLAPAVAAAGPRCIFLICIVPMVLWSVRYYTCAIGACLEPVRVRISRPRDRWKE
jgi:hypothetical protein